MVDTLDHIRGPSRLAQGTLLFVTSSCLPQSGKILSELRLMLLWRHDKCGRCNHYEAATDSALRLASLQVLLELAGPPGACRSSWRLQVLLEHLGKHSRPWVQTNKLFRSKTTVVTSVSIMRVASGYSMATGQTKWANCSASQPVSFSTKKIECRSTLIGLVRVNAWFTQALVNKRW